MIVMRFMPIVRMLVRCRLALLALLATWSALWMSPVAGAVEMSEYDIKTAWLYKFAQFTEWPTEAANGPFNFCVLGNAPFGLQLADLQKIKIKNRDVVVRRQPHPDEWKQCHVLFISASEQTVLPKILVQLNGFPVLTVAEVEGALEQGVAINLVWDKNIAFDVNAAAVERAKLSISFKMLKVARHVR